MQNEHTTFLSTQFEQKYLCPKLYMISSRVNCERPPKLLLFFFFFETEEILLNSLRKRLLNKNNALDGGRAFLQPY
jgi:hypothetical protein